MIPRGLGHPFQLKSSRQSVREVNSQEEEEEKKEEEEEGGGREKRQPLHAACSSFFVAAFGFILADTEREVKALLKVLKTLGCLSKEGVDVTEYMKKMRLEDRQAVVVPHILTASTFLLVLKAHHQLLSQETNLVLFFVCVCVRFVLFSASRAMLLVLLINAQAHDSRDDADCV